MFDGDVAKLHAVRRIPKDEALTISYIDIAATTGSHRCFPITTWTPTAAVTTICATSYHMP